jgi:type I restriction enzyme S subunit
VLPLQRRYSVELGKMLDAKQITGRHLVPYLRNTDVQWDRINAAELPLMDIAPEEYDRYTVRPGDLLVCEGGDVGRCAFWDGQLPLCGYQKALHRLRPIDDTLDNPRYLFYLMYSASKQGVFRADGSENTIAHLTREKLCRHRFAFPPRAEQDVICAMLADELRNIDAAIVNAGRQIDLIREHQDLLVSRTVLGQLDARVLDLGKTTEPDLNPSISDESVEAEEEDEYFEEVGVADE